LDGKVHEVRRPNIAEIETYETKEKEAENKFKFVLSFLSQLGLPESVVSNTCTIDELNSIVDSLVNKKKT
jgi:hypothetical protein